MTDRKLSIDEVEANLRGAENDAAALPRVIRALELMPDPPEQDQREARDRYFAARDKGLRIIAATLLAHGITQGDLLAALGQLIPTPQWAITAVARDLNDEREIDDYPLNSEGEGGCWVSGWFWAAIPDPNQFVVYHFDGAGNPDLAGWRWQHIDDSPAIGGYGPFPTKAAAWANIGFTVDEIEEGDEP